MRKMWLEGKGIELVHGDFSELHSIGNLDCPHCSHLVAYWQAPLRKDYPEQKLNKPSDHE